MAAVLIACSLGLHALQSGARQAGRTDAITTAARTAASPISAVVAGGAGWVEGVRDGFVAAPALRRENERLRQDLAAAQVYMESEAVSQRKIESLRVSAGVPMPPGREGVMGRIVSFTPLENRLVAEVADASSITMNLPVLVSGNLCGIVESIDGKRIQVLLLSSPSAQIGAMVVRDVPTAGIMRGAKADALTMEVVGGAPIEAGDLVVTSGYSQWIPGQIPIGEVTDVQELRDFGTRSVTVFPRFRVEPAQEVLIIGSKELAAKYPPGMPKKGAK